MNAGRKVRWKSIKKEENKTGKEEREEEQKRGMQRKEARKVK